MSDGYTFSSTKVKTDEENSSEDTKTSEKIEYTSDFIIKNEELNGNEDINGDEFKQGTTTETLPNGTKKVVIEDNFDVMFHSFYNN